MLPNLSDFTLIRARAREEDKMLESTIERRLVEGVKKLGGLCFKFSSPGNPGVPDRIIITATGRVIFVELKTETGRLAKIQRYTIDEMKKRGADVRVTKGLSDVKELLKKIGGITDDI